MACGELPIGNYKVKVAHVSNFDTIKTIKIKVFQILTDELRQTQYDHNVGSFYYYRTGCLTPTFLYGLIFARVLPPQKEMYPFLMFRSSISCRTSIPLCKVCADSQYHGSCSHTDW